MEQTSTPILSTKMVPLITTKLDLLVVEFDHLLWNDPHYRRMSSGQPYLLFHRLTPSSFSRITRIVRSAWPKIPAGERVAVERKMKAIKKCAVELFTPDELKQSDLAEAKQNTTFPEEMSEREIGILWRSRK